MRKVELSGLTGIRFYAALVVFLYHVPNFIPGMTAFGGSNVFLNSGDLGVAFFFVLSGFILTYNYANVFRQGVCAASFKRFLWDRLQGFYTVYFLKFRMVLPLALFCPHPT